MNEEPGHPQKTERINAPPTFPTATPRQRVAIWMDLMRAGEQLMRAGMRHRNTADDLAGEYHGWYERTLERRDAERASGRSIPAPSRKRDDD